MSKSCKVTYFAIFGLDFVSMINSNSFKKTLKFSNTLECTPFLDLFSASLPKQLSFFLECLEFSKVLLNFGFEWCKFFITVCLFGLNFGFTDTVVGVFQPWANLIPHVRDILGTPIFVFGIIHNSLDSVHDLADFGVPHEERMALELHPDV